MVSGMLVGDGLNKGHAPFQSNELKDQGLGPLWDKYAIDAAGMVVCVWVHIWFCMIVVWLVCMFGVLRLG